MRQISQYLGVGRKRLSRLLQGVRVMERPRERILRPYERLMESWYEEYPRLRATQVYERLRGYGYSGCYETVCIGTRRFRQRRKEFYHELDFLPGECAQVDWLEVRLPWGVAYGFGMILAYSRYLFVRFYPRQSLEFFLEGHIEAYREMAGVAHQHWYDNIKTVVIQRRPELKLNAQFLDFARHFGFSIHLCNPYRANEKGRIERALRDLRDWLRVNSFEDLQELNRKVSLWRMERNQRIHRATQKAPLDALKEEKLKPLPAIAYRPYRVVAAFISKTGFVEFETNRYSVPSIYSEIPCEILAYPDHIEILVRGKKVVSHERSFGRRQKIEDPSHREPLLAKTPNFKLKRIYELLRRMDPSVSEFLSARGGSDSVGKGCESEGQDPIKVSYELFKILRSVSKAVFLSALREAKALGVYRIQYIQSLLRLPESQQDHPVYPQDKTILEIHYQGRELKDYDELI